MVFASYHAVGSQREKVIDGEDGVRARIVVKDIASGGGQGQEPWYFVTNTQFRVYQNGTCHRWIFQCVWMDAGLFGSLHAYTFGEGTKGDCEVSGVDELAR